MFQLVTWSLTKDPDCARRILRLLVQAVAEGSAPLPSLIYSSELVNSRSSDPKFQGGFSDVFYAVTQSGHTVALKRVRLTMPLVHRPAFVAVSSTL